MHSIQVDRYSFWISAAGNLRWAEHYPKAAYTGVESHVCCCTKNAQEKPSGDPTQIKQSISYLDADTSVEFVLWPSCWLIVRGRGRGPHTYFMFGENSVKIEIVREGSNAPGMQSLDDGSQVFFAHLYTGKNVDTSKFFNGHSPSRLAQIHELKDHDVWAHWSGFGSEAMRVLSSDVERMFWRDMIVKSQLCTIKISQALSKQDTWQTLSVEDTWKTVTAAHEVIDNAQALVRDLIAWDNLATGTEVFRLAAAAYRDTRHR